MNEDRVLVGSQASTCYKTLWWGGVASLVVTRTKTEVEEEVVIELDGRKDGPWLAP